MSDCEHGVVAAAEGDLYPPEPESYVAWHDWAEQMGKTHRQVRCEVCGLFKRWVPKSVRAATEEPETTEPDATGGSRVDDLCTPESVAQLIKDVTPAPRRSRRPESGGGA